MRKKNLKIQMLAGNSLKICLGASSHIKVGPSPLPVLKSSILVLKSGILVLKKSSAY